MDFINGGQALLEEISSMIEQMRQTLYYGANREIIRLFWNIGHRISADILNNKRSGPRMLTDRTALVQSILLTFHHFPKTQSFRSSSGK